MHKTTEGIALCHAVLDSAAKTRRGNEPQDIPRPRLAGQCGFDVKGCDRWPVAGDTPHSWAAATDGVVIGVLIGLKQLAAAWPKEERFANI